MKLKPTFDNVVLKFVEAEKVTKSGIVLPDTAKERPQIAEVIAVGPGVYDNNGILIPMNVKEGDKVICAKYAGTEVKVDGTEYMIVEQHKILSIVED